MASSGTFQISADSVSGRKVGSNPSGVAAPVVNPNTLRIGTLVANPTTGNGAWPMADLVKMSSGWTDNGGTGTYTINEKEHVTIDGTAQLQRQICYDFLQTFPRAGTYTVFKTGSAEVSILAGGVDSGFQSASSFTFTAAPSQAITLYVRSGDGSAADLTAVSIVYSEDVVAFQANANALAGGWLSYIRDDMPSPIVRNLLPHEVFEQDFARRTTPDSLSYVSVLERDTFLSAGETFGARASTFSLEVQAGMVNDIGADTFYWNIPPHASNDWVLQASTLIHSVLNAGIRVAIAYTNESWNTLFWYNAQVVRTIHIAKTTFSTVPSSNTWTSVGHGFTNGQLLASIVSPNSSRLAGFGPYHASGDSWPAPVLTRIQVTNATADTVDMVLQSDGVTPFTAPAGVTEVYGWLETAFDLDGANFDTQVDNSHGLRSSQMFDVAVPVFTAGGRESVRVIETQSDFISRTQERIGVNGANGNFDVVSLGAYYNAAEEWQVGDSEATMEAANIVSAEAVIQTGFIAHINIGILPENIWTYEAGAHLLAVLGSNGTQQEREQAFLDFALTQGMANTENYFFNRCQQIGIRNMVITSTDLYVYGTSGTWGSKSELYLPDIPRTTLYRTWKDGIVPSAADLVAPTIALNGAASVDVVVNTTYTDQGATWNDNVDGTGQVFADLSGVDYSTVGGSYTLPYFYPDAAGNVSITVNRILNIVAANAAITSLRQYAFHHSLWQHTDATYPNGEVWTDWWIGELTNSAALDYRSSGQFGQLENQTIPPEIVTGAANTPDAWIEGVSFTDAAFDSLVVMPANFVYETETVATTVAKASAVMAYIEASSPSSDVWVYEHMQEAASNALTTAEINAYWEECRTNYHTWYVSYYDGLVAAHPTLNFRIVPCGPIMADMFLGAIRNGVDPAPFAAINDSQILWQDNSPHGEPVTYFLYAAICYQAFFEQDLPLAYVPPSGLATATITNNWSLLNDYIRESLVYYRAQGLNI